MDLQLAACFDLSCRAMDIVVLEINDGLLIVMAIKLFEMDFRKPCSPCPLQTFVFAGHFSLCLLHHLPPKALELLSSNTRN
jgi:hypothetical protein